MGKAEPHLATVRHHRQLVSTLQSVADNVDNNAVCRRKRGSPVLQEMHWLAALFNTLHFVPGNIVCQMNVRYTSA